ncbi:MAG TPA: SRPBCC domain-containing protein [Planctomycetota bacterium]
MADQPTVSRSGERHVTIQRRFAASSCTQVFAALTTPDLLRHWLHAAGRKLTASEIDLRPGGSYRHTFSAPGRSAFVMYGTFREVVPAQRIVQTEAYEGYDWAQLVVVTDLAAAGRDTVMTIVIEYPSKEICDRDMPNLDSAAAAYDGLAEVLAQRPQ